MLIVLFAKTIQWVIVLLDQEKLALSCSLFPFPPPPPQTINYTIISLYLHQPHNLKTRRKKRLLSDCVYVCMSYQRIYQIALMEIIRM